MQMILHSCFNHEISKSILTYKAPPKHISSISSSFWLEELILIYCAVCFLSLLFSPIDVLVTPGFSKFYIYDLLIVFLKG